MIDTMVGLSDRPGLADGLNVSSKALGRSLAVLKQVKSDILKFSCRPGVGTVILVSCVWNHHVDLSVSRLLATCRLGQGRDHNEL